MLRKLAFALSLLGAGFTGLVHALGLGEATVVSSLNQPLSAEIELVNVRDLSVNEILPGLATREEFLKANVDRVYFLSDLRFKVTKNDEGSLVVVLTSNKPVREPFLNFLVEVIWPSGRLLREYALLIDPPLFNEETAAPVQVASVQSSNTPVSTSSDRVVSGDVVSIGAVNTVQSQTGTAGETYGATNSNDTLWEIAIRARPDRSVTPQQVMLSIQDLNPGAFINQNINKLKAGQVLRLPTLDQIKQRSSSQAIIEVIAQNEADRPKRSKSIASVAKATSTKKQAPQSTGDELKLVVPNNESAASNSANSGSSEGSGDGLSDSSKDLMIALEKLDKTALENTELNSRVNDLEEQLKTLQRILTLKNDQLANLQSQARVTELSQVSGSSPTSDLESIDQKVKGPDENIEAGGIRSESENQVLSEESAAVEGEPASVDSLENPADQSGKSLADSMSVSEEAVVPKSVEKAAPDTAEPSSKESENIVQQIMNNPLYSGLAGLGVIILLVVLWAVSRRNATKEQEYYAQTSAVDEDTSDSDEKLNFDEDSGEKLDSDVLGDIDEDVEQYDEDTASEAHDSDESEDDEDVIAEADVYIAYGRLDQAATILEEAISADPVRTDYRLKLLTVYKDNNDVEAFNRQFSELEAIQDASAIEVASQIRNELLLEDELLSIDDQEQALEESSQQDDALLSEQQDDEAAEEIKQAELSEEVLESDADSFSFDTVEEDESTEENLDIDFSSDELELDLDVDIDLADEDKPTAEEESALELTEEGINFESALDQSETTELSDDDSSVLEIDSDDLSQLDAELDDVELGDIDLSGELDKEAEIELSPDLLLPEEAGAETEKPDVEGKTDDSAVVSDDILDEAVEAFGGAEDLEDDLTESDDFDFLEGTDESSTKLDLARAYIDMGDIEGAKDILEEVVKEGSEEQQAEATDLLGALDT